MKIMVDSEYLDKLKKNLGFKEDGSLEVGKNLEVDGTAKMNGGFEPIHEYEFEDAESQHWKLDVYFEGLADEADLVYQFIGQLYVDGISYAGIVYGTYRFDYVEGKIDPNYIQFLDFNGVNGTPNPSIIYFSNNTRERTRILTDLDGVTYRHILSLSGSGSGSDNTCRLEYLSSNSLKCDSIQDLRTLLGNPQMLSLVASNPSGDLFGVVVSASTAQFKKVGGTSLTNITTVSDTVTTI